CAGGRLDLRFAIEVVEEVERVEEGGDEVEERAQANAAGHQVVLADAQLGEPLEACGITCDQRAAAQEGEGRVTRVEVADGRVAKLQGSVDELGGAGHEQGDERLEP